MEHAVQRQIGAAQRDLDDADQVIGLAEIVVRRMDAVAGAGTISLNSRAIGRVSAYAQAAAKNTPFAASPLIEGTGEFDAEGDQFTSGPMPAS